MKGGSYDATISDLIFVTQRLQRSIYFIGFKDYKNANITTLNNDLQTAPWSLISLFDDVYDTLWCWENLFKTIFGEQSHQNDRILMRAKGRERNSQQ